MNEVPGFRVLLAVNHCPLFVKTYFEIRNEFHLCDLFKIKTFFALQKFENLFW